MLNRVRLIKEIDNLKMYCDLTQDHFKNLDNELRTGNLREENFLKWIQVTDRYSHELPLILNHSLLISLIAFLENQLNLICKSLQIKSGIESSITDYKGTGIYKAEKYLTSSKINYDFSDTNNEWKKIKSCIPIRNCIVHCGGDVNQSNNKEKVRESIDNFEMRQIFETSRNKIVIHKSFIFEIISAIESVLDSLYSIAIS